MSDRAKVFNFEHSEKPEECHSCGFKTEDLTEYDPSAFAKARRSHWLCLLCASTCTGNAVSYPEQYPEKRTLEVICFVGNTILAVIKAKS